MPWRGQLSWCVGRRPEKGQKMPDEHPKPARAAATGAVLIAACNQSPHELDHEMSVHDLPGGRVRLRVGQRAQGCRRGVVLWCKTEGNAMRFVPNAKGSTKPDRNPLAHL